jgi:copper chaperone CopZ
MEKIYKFKTNINCGGCVAKVAQNLNSAEGICHWDVDTENSDKILTVHSNGISKNDIVEAVKDKGFRIELIETGE